MCRLFYFIGNGLIGDILEAWEQNIFTLVSYIFKYMLLRINNNVDFYNVRNEKHFATSLLSPKINSKNETIISYYYKIL